MSGSKTIKGKFQRVYIDAEFKSLKHFFRKADYSSIIILTDSNTERLCLPDFISVCKLKNYLSVSIPPGEQSKCLATAEKLWEQMMPIADRNSVLVNLGGGMITDIGGFVASVFKRGIDFIHVPTTLLSMVDASIGGKTAVDFANHKNQLGTFAQPKAVFISDGWLNTLPAEQLLSAKAEMAKQAMLAGTKEWQKFILNFDNEHNISDQICQAVEFKIKIADKDLVEKSVRKQLNFGHTIGHALESFCLQKSKPVPHGFAIAAGMICELNLSENYYGLKANPFGEQLEFLNEKFPKINFNEKEIDEITSFIANDKKNNHGKIKPVLIKRIGKPEWDAEVKIEMIADSLKKYIDAYAK